ncbi:bacillithiol biosynthesis cysteine-adding enzyme BshC [Algoriphagus namhaensis]
MKKHGIDLKDTRQFSTFFLDYLAGKRELKDFYEHEPKLESFQQAIANKKFGAENRHRLYQALASQYDKVDLPEAASANLALLLDEKTFTVTTGHQLNLFTGPLYFIYKIISTINLARKLKENYPEYNFVPVYWMASEDHDFEEINYFKLDGKKYEWKSEQKGAVGDFQLDGSFHAFLKEVSFAAPVFLNAYRASETLSEAVRGYVNTLFGEQGLLIVDGHDRLLKQAFSEVILDELTSHTAFVAASSTTDSLEKLGYSSQIFPREINLFYLAEGCRERIEKVGEDYVVLNTDIRFTQSEIIELVKSNPERFSPNVVLRPLYQEMILPNLAYLGGPSEMVYWLQLKGVFESFHTPFPVLIPRNFALLLDKPIQRKIESLGWAAGDLFQDFGEWKKAYVNNHAQVDIGLAKEREALEELYDTGAEKAGVLEKSLCDAFEAGKVRSLKILDQMSRKLRKAEEKRHQITFDRVHALENYLHPGGSPQERVVNIMQFYLAYPDLIDRLLNTLDPLDFKMWVIEL